MAISLGAKQFTKVAVKSEASYGTPATMTSGTPQLLFTDIVGIMDPGVVLELADDKTAGVRASRIGGLQTVTEKNPTVTIGATNISMADLPLFFDALATITPTGASAPYTWSYDPAMTDVDTITSYTMFATDGVQKFIADGCVPTELTISSEASGLLQAGVTFSARNIAATTDTLSASAAAGTAKFVPGRYAKVYTDTNFPTNPPSGETQYSQYVTAFNFTLMPGAAPLVVLSGSINYGGVAYTGALDASLTLTIASNSSATSTFPLSSIGDTKYVRVECLDASGYGMEIRGRFVVENVQVIGSETDGLILNEVTLQATYDATAAENVEVAVFSPTAARP